jgi:hypothetical protein
MSSNDHNINFNIEIDQETEIYRAIHNFSLEQASKHSSRKDVRRNLANSLEKIVVNLLTGNASYHIAMNKNKTDKGTRYQCDIHKFKYRKQSLEILDELGFITQEIGSWKKQKQTVVYVHHSLLEYFSKYGTADYYFKRDEFIVIRETFTTPWFKKIKRNLDYVDDDTTNSMREEVELINQMLISLDITYQYRLRSKDGDRNRNRRRISSSSSSSSSNTNVDSSTNLLVSPLCKDTSYNQIHRIFNDSSFTLGGRMYGAYWINIKKIMRQGMTINDERCSEIDFSSMHIAQLYALDGYPHSDDYDAYDIPKLFAMGVSRDGIKKQTQRMINKREPAKSFSHCNDKTIRKEFKGLDYDTAIQPILDKHPKIAKHFYSGIGLKLANDEARIMIDVIKQLIKLNIPALPLHDALITQNKHEKKVQELMQERFFEFYGVPISASIKRL